MLLAGLLVAAVVAALPRGADDADDAEDDGLPPIAEQAADDEVTIAAPAPDPLEDVETTVDVEDWKRLADCESGDWSRTGDPEPESARWNYGLVFDHGDTFQGGLNFHPTTWDAYRDPDMPDHAGLASRWEEIEVAERVLDDQGWDAWPTCSEMVGLADEDA